MQVKKWVLINALVSTALTLPSSITLAAINTSCPAIDAQQQIILKSQSEPCADINIKATDRLIGAMRISEHGFHSEAQKELIEVIKLNQNTKFSEELIDSIVKKKPSTLESIIEEIDRQFLPATSLVNFINSLITRLAIPLVLISAITFYFRRKSIIYLDIKDFNDDNLDLKIGKSTTTALKNLLLKTAEPGETSRPNIATEPISKFESTIDIERLSLPLQLLNTLFTARSFALSGYYQQSTRKGIGLVLVLRLPSGTIRTENFWQKDYDSELKISKQEPQQLNQILARAAASWLLFELDKESFERWLGFNSWKSYAFSKVGEYWLEKNNDSQAEEMMKRSLLHHPRNRFSLFNLGVLKFRQSLQTQNNQEINTLLLESKNSLLRAKKSIEPDNLLPQQSYSSTDPIWYKILYQLAQIDEYNLIKNYQLSQVSHLQANYAEDLVKAIEKYQNNNSYLNKECHESLKEFLEKFLAISKTAYAIFLVRTAQTEKSFKLAKIKAEDIMILVRQGNLITIDVANVVFLYLVKQSYKEILLKIAGSEIESLKAKYIMAFAHESDLIGINEEGNLLLFHDGEIRLSARSKEIPMLPLLGYYNLACYYAALAEVRSNNKEECDRCTREASIYLKYVFKQDKTQEEWAKKDPSLKWILKKDPLLIPSS